MEVQRGEACNEEVQHVRKKCGIEKHVWMRYSIEEACEEKYALKKHVKNEYSTEQATLVA